MRKLKLLLAAAALFGVSTAWAQTDVTSTYLKNADFSKTTPLDNHLCGYGKDMEGKGTTYYGLQTVDDWTAEVLSGDNSKEEFPNSGMGGAVFAYGSDSEMKGNNTKAPTADPDGNSGKCLGFFAVWGCGGYYYQEATLQAGKYTINIPVYNQSGTQGNTSYIGWIPEEGTSYTLATNPTVGQWSTLTATFTLTVATKGKICLGYKSTGSGSGANAMLYFDKVQLLYTAVVVKDALQTALTTATTANAKLNNSELTTAISTAQEVYDNASATQEQVNNAVTTLNEALGKAISSVGDVTSLFLVNPGFESCTVTTENAAAAADAAPMDIAGGWTQVGSAAWSSSAVVAYGGEGQVNGASAPEADNAGNSGNALGVSVGWGGTVTYQSAAVTLPAGVYTLQVHAYNALASAQQFASKFGFVPASGSGILSTKKSFKSNEWEIDKVTLTLNEATEGKIQVGGQAVEGGSGSNAKVFFDNITITYKSFLAGAKEAWDEVVAAAGTAKNECTSVTGDELTSLNAELAKAEPTTIEGYNEAKKAIEDAITTLRNAKVAYDAYKEIYNVAVALGMTVSGDAPTSATAATTAAHSINVAVFNSTKADNIFDVTNAFDPSWSSMSTSSGQHWSGDASISYADEWRGDTNPTTRTATVTLPAGSYILMSAGRGSTNTVTTMSANDVTVTFASNGDVGLGINKKGVASFDSEDAEGFANKKDEAENTGTGWEWRYIPVKLTEETAITVTQTLTRLTGSAWGSFSDFKILKKGVVATTDDYAALNSAIKTAEGKTLGFEPGEFAPYNNIDALKALAAAKAIDQEQKNDQDAIQAITTALANWTANTEELNAIHNGDFATNKDLGWEFSAWGEFVSGLNANTNASNGTARSSNGGTLTYGKKTGYTMPLKANTLYRLTFKVSSWDNNNKNTSTEVSILNSSEEGLATKSFGASTINRDQYGAFKTYTTVFETGAAGDYTFVITAKGQRSVYTDIVLKKAVPEEVEITAAGFATFANDVDIDFTNVEGLTAYKATINGSTATFTKVTKVPAGEGVLLKGAAGKYNCPVTAGVTAWAEEDNAFVRGNDAAVPTNDGTTYNYVLSTKNGVVGFYSAADKTVAKNQAYLQTTKSEGRLSIVFEDGTTGISSVMNADSNKQNEVYNLNGQRVRNAAKGLYIQNGKKVLVK